MSATKFAKRKESEAAVAVSDAFVPCFESDLIPLSLFAARERQRESVCSLPVR